MTNRCSNAVIVGYLLFAFFWDSPESNLIERKLKLMLRPLVTGLGLSYRWNMYAGPFTHIIEITAHARYEDETTEVVALPSRYEFRRYSFMLARQRRDELYQAFALYIEYWLATNDRRPLEITLVRRTAKTPKRLGGIWGRFDIERDPKFHEIVVAKRILQ